MESRHLGDGEDRAPSRPLGGSGVSPLHPVGRAVPGEPPPPYCTSITTLKNRITAFSAAVAPSTAFHSPSSVAAPFSILHPKQEEIFEVAHYSTSNNNVPVS